MADFCYHCTVDMFGEEYAERNDFSGLVKEGKFLTGLCEGCGIITVDHEGKKVKWDNEKLNAKN